MSNFLRRLFGPPALTFEQQLIERLMSENASLRDRLLLLSGAPLEPPRPQAAPAAAEPVQFDPDQAEREAVIDDIEERAIQAANDPDYFQYALEMAEEDERWHVVLAKASAMMDN